MNKFKVYNEKINNVDMICVKFNGIPLITKFRKDSNPDHIGKDILSFYKNDINSMGFDVSNQDLWELTKLLKENVIRKL